MTNDEPKCTGGDRTFAYSPVAHEARRALTARKELARARWRHVGADHTGETRRQDTRVHRLARNAIANLPPEVCTHATAPALAMAREGARTHHS